MIGSEIAEAVHAEPLAIWNRHLLTKNYRAAFATDLMSDALAMIREYPDETVLITGLCNAQVLRTAEMLDIEMIIIVRGKKLGQDEIEMAQDMGCNLFTTELTMYEACGLLYQKGMRGIEK